MTLSLASLSAEDRVPVAAGRGQTTQAPQPARLEPMLKDSNDLLWALALERQNLGTDLQQMLKALDASSIPDMKAAEGAAIRFTLANGGLLAEETIRVVALLRLGRDVLPFARRGTLVWVVRTSHVALGVTQEVWVSSETGEVRATLPVGR
jgi:hypothetical protein